MGLKSDLEECLKQLNDNGFIGEFTLATKDNSQVLCISEKLYGRKGEVEMLVQAFERSKNSSPELILVSGYSGIGKTRLINEIDKPVAAYNGYFATGKFDQYNRDTPYSVFKEAIGLLMRDILSENDESIRRWRKIILGVLGENGQVIIDIIPELELLIGKQQPVLKLGLNENNARFCNIFQKFLGALSGQKNHLVIFLDDLQWADSGSLDLVHKTVLNLDLRNVLLIGAYRDNEVNASHPLMLLLERIKEDAPGKASIITLSQLDYEMCNQLIADTLRLKPGNTTELTDLVMDKTQGNPFFIKQFIKRIAEEGLIYFDVKEAKWNWNYVGIKEMDVTDNVVDLLVKKIQKIPESSKMVLEFASCVGNSFDVQTVAVIANESESNLVHILWDLVKEGFIKPTNKWNKHSKDELWKEFGLLDGNTGYDFFQFQHDKIQQAVYSLISQEEREQIHLKIGLLLLEKYQASGGEGSLFEMLNHLNFSINLITDEKERLLIAQLNYQAGDKAKRSNAYQPALIYFKAAMDLLAKDSTSELFKNLLLARCETEYLCGNHQESDALFNRALDNAKNNIEKAQVLANKMSLYENTNRQVEAIKIALQGLKFVGVDLPENPGPLHILRELIGVKYNLRNKSIEKLKQNKDMDLPEMMVAVKILVNLWGPAYLYNQELLALAILRGVSLSIRFGNVPESAVAYAFYGFLCCAQFNDYETGRDFARFGMWLNEKFEDKSLRSKVYVIYGGCVGHWTVKYADLLETLVQAHEVGVESNDLIYASYAFSFHGKTRWFKGDNLIECRNTVDKYIHFCRQIQYPLTMHYMMTLGRALYDLTNTKPDETLFQDSADANEHLRQMKEIEARDGTTLFLATHFIYQGIVACHLANYEKAVEIFGEAKRVLAGVLGLADPIFYKFYLSISIAAKEKDLSHISGKQRSFIKSTLKLFKKLSAKCPENFKAQYCLLVAEWERLNGQIVEAGRFYNSARLVSKESESYMTLALANERSARFYYRIGFNDLGNIFLRETYATNMEWGAAAKNIQLKKEFPDFNFPQKSLAAHLSNPDDPASDLSSSWVDLQSIFKASTTISGEIVFERLVEKLLKIIIENAGAQKVFLILNDNGVLRAQAYANSEGYPVRFLGNQPVENVPDIAHSVVQLVFHTDETLIVNDAISNSRFSKDPYIQSQKPKSILCLPVKKHGITTAILYLENNIASGSFTAARLNLLNLLSGQIAISLENSTLYEKLEQKVIDRTKTIENQKVELEAEKEKSDQLLLNILPFETAEELKATGRYKPREYENVSIIFTDFEDFTKLSEQLSTEELVKMIDYCYREFDQIVSKHNVEKIKTIGDSYMCVSGLPVASPQHGINAVKAALEMVAFIEKFNNERKEKNLPFCKMRIGIHSGPVVAGVVGSKKFAYDIWGDSVNIASRIETSDDAGKVNISSSTYELVRNEFTCIYRGKIKAKNKGEIDMYFVN